MALAVDLGQDSTTNGRSDFAPLLRQIRPEVPDRTQALPQDARGGSSGLLESRRRKLGSGAG